MRTEPLSSRSDDWSDRILESSSLAAVLFLTLMAAAGLLLLAGKIQFASLGSGASPFDVLRAIGLIALASLGTTIDLDGLELSVIPLGLLVAVAGVFSMLARRSLAVARRTPADAALVGLAFAVLALVGALVFRFGGDAPVTASPVGAFLRALLWGTLIAASAMRLSLRAAKREATGAVRSARTVLAVAAYLSLVALLLMIIGRLVSGPIPPAFGIADAIAATLYLIAFLPNVLVAVFSLAVGATIDVGAQVNVGGEMVGPLRSISLWQWGSGPWLRWLLPAIPIGLGLACARRAGKRSADVAGSGAHVASTAGFVAIAVGIAAALGDARLGAGLVRENGVGLVAVNALQATLFTFLWVAGVALLTLVAERRRRIEGDDR